MSSWARALPLAQARPGVGRGLVVGGMVTRGSSWQRALSPLLSRTCAHTLPLPARAGLGRPPTTRTGPLHMCHTATCTISTPHRPLVPWPLSLGRLRTYVDEDSTNLQSAAVHRPSPCIHFPFASPAPPHKQVPHYYLDLQSLARQYPHRRNF